MSALSATEVELYQRLMDQLHSASRLAFRMGMTRSDLQGLQWKAAVETQERMTQELLRETAAWKVSRAEGASEDAPPSPREEDVSTGGKSASKGGRDAR